MSPSIFSVPIGTADAQVPYINTDIWLHHSQQLPSLSHIWRSTKIQTEPARPSLSSYAAQPALGYFPSSPVAPRVNKPQTAEREHASESRCRDAWHFRAGQPGELSWYFGVMETPLHVRSVWVSAPQGWPRLMAGFCSFNRASTWPCEPARATRPTAELLCQATAVSSCLLLSPFPSQM